MVKEERVLVSRFVILNVCYLVDFLLQEIVQLCVIWDEFVNPFVFVVIESALSMFFQRFLKLLLFFIFTPSFLRRKFRDTPSGLPSGGYFSEVAEPSRPVDVAMKPSSG